MQDSPWFSALLNGCTPGWETQGACCPMSAGVVHVSADRNQNADMWQNIPCVNPPEHRH